MKDEKKIVMLKSLQKSTITAARMAEHYLDHCRENKKPADS